MIVMITRRKHKIPDWYGITVEFECDEKLKACTPLNVERNNNSMD